MYAIPLLQLVTYINVTLRNVTMAKVVRLHESIYELLQSVAKKLNKKMAQVTLDDLKLQNVTGDVTKSNKLLQDVTKSYKELQNMLQTVTDSYKMLQDALQNVTKSYKELQNQLQNVTNKLNILLERVEKFPHEVTIIMSDILDRINQQDQPKKQSYEVSFKRAYEYTKTKFEDERRLIKLAINRLYKIDKEYLTDEDLKKVWEQVKKNSQFVKTFDQFKTLLLNQGVIYEPESGKYKLM